MARGVSGMGMKYLEISLKMPTDYREEELRRELERTLGTGNFTYQLESKSLDARRKQHPLADQGGGFIRGNQGR